jgi:uncharacterized membrane protein YdbT with pleckstrin-like domain
MSGYIEKLLGANEKILVIERQHWLVWLPQLFVSLIIIAVITVASLLVSTTAPFGIFGLVFDIIPVLIFLRVILDWHNEEYIVTTRRIIQSEGVINKNVVDSSLEKINDVVLAQSFFGRILDFGDLEILTSSDFGINKLHRIQSPVKFKIAMLNAKEAMRDLTDIGELPKDHQHSAHGDVPTMIAELDDLRKKGLITEAEFQEKRAKLMSQI